MVFSAFNPDRQFVGSYKGWFFAKLVGFAMNLAPQHIGQTRVAEVGLEIGPYCYMFCDGSKEFRVSGSPLRPICAPDCPRVTALLGLPR